MRTFFITVIVILSTAVVTNAQVNATLSFKKRDCSPRRGFDCRETDDARNSDVNSVMDFNTTFSVKNDYLSVRIYRDRISEKDELQLFGTVIDETNAGQLVFRLTEEIDFDFAVALTLKPNLKEQTISLPAKAYATAITEDFIDITLLKLDTQR